MDETLRNLRTVIARKMDFHAPYAKALLGDMLGVGPSSRSDILQENLDVLTVQVEAVGSGKVIIPALELTSMTTINDIKKKIFDIHKLKTIKHFEAYRLFINHGGTELTDLSRQMGEVRVNRVVAVTQNEEKDLFMPDIMQNCWALIRASEMLKNDRDIVMTAVKQNGFALRFASETLRNDRDIVMAAVTQNGFALACASKTLKNDKVIVMAAVTENWDALVYASETRQISIIYKDIEKE